MFLPRVIKKEEEVSLYTRIEGWSFLLSEEEEKKKETKKTKGK